ncbi:MAG: M28 family peptidase [Bacteroidales bacterium]
MKHRQIPGLIIAIFFIASAVSLFAQPPCRVDQQMLKQHVYYLASDSLEGRNTGEPGQKAAASYIAQAFSEIGLQPLADGDFYQRFCLYSNSQPRLSFKGPARMVTAVVSHFQVPDTCSIYYMGKSTRVPGDLMGRRDVFLMIRPEGLKDARRMIGRLAAQGNHSIIVIMESGSIRGAVRKKEATDRSLRVKPESDPGKLSRLTSGIDTFGIAFMSPAQVRLLTGYNLPYEEFDKQVKKHRTAISLNLRVPCEFQEAKVDSVQTENIAGMLKGMEGADEYIVLTAHYDHVGKEGGKIHPGADDNASGTAALMEIARILSCEVEQGLQLKRSVIFAALSAEELGLLGAEYFVESPEFEGKNTMLNMNMDMIGRSIKYPMIKALIYQETGNYTEDTIQREAYVYLLNKGKKTRKYVRISKASARQFDGFKIDRTPGLLERLTFKMSSDHRKFHQKGIPIMVWFTGLHPDYHTPRDTRDKIDYVNLTRVTRIITETTREILIR